MLSIRANSRSAMKLASKRACLTRQAFACLLALALAAPLFGAGEAFADVRATDELAGATVAERGVPAVACPNVTAERVLVVDEAGEVYFSRDADAQCHIASITKVMTAIVALDAVDAGLSLDTLVTVSAEAAQVGESSAGLQTGDVLTLKAALTGLMVPSGNDAAIAIGETVGAVLAEDGQDATEAFVAAMNAKAADLGMTDTLFSNPHGLDVGDHDEEMYSTARDVAAMCAYAMKNDTFRDIVSQDNAQLTVTREDGRTATVDLVSTDMMLGVYEGACGIKTGFTDQAGNSFAGACNRGEGDLYAIVLGAPSETSRFEDAEALFDWVYGNRLTYALAHSDQTVSASIGGATAEVPVIAEVPHTAWPDKRIKATLADPDATVEVFAFDGNVSQEVVAHETPGAVEAGDVVGAINFYQGNELLATQDLVAAESSPAPDIITGLGIWWNRLWAGLTGAKTTTDTVIVNETPLIYDKTSTNQSLDELRAIAAGQTPADDGTADEAQPPSKEE